MKVCRFLPNLEVVETYSTPALTDAAYNLPPGTVRRAIRAHMGVPHQDKLLYFNYIAPDREGQTEGNNGAPLAECEQIFTNEAQIERINSHSVVDLVSKRHYASQKHASTCHRLPKNKLGYLLKNPQFCLIRGECALFTRFAAEKDAYSKARRHLLWKAQASDPTWSQHPDNPAYFYRKGDAEATQEGDLVKSIKGL